MPRHLQGLERHHRFDDEGRAQVPPVRRPERPGSDLAGDRRGRRRSRRRSRPARRRRLQIGLHEFGHRMGAHLDRSRRQVGDPAHLQVRGLNIAEEVSQHLLEGPIADRLGVHWRLSGRGHQKEHLRHRLPDVIRRKRFAEIPLHDLMDLRPARRPAWSERGADRRDRNHQGQAPFSEIGMSDGLEQASGADLEQHRVYPRGRGCLNGFGRWHEPSFASNGGVEVGSAPHPKRGNRFQTANKRSLSRSPAALAACHRSGRLKALGMVPKAE